MCTGLQLSRKRSHNAKVILKTTHCLFSLRKQTVIDTSRRHLSLLWFVSQMLGDNISCAPSVKEIAFIFLFMQKDIAGYFVNVTRLCWWGGCKGGLHDKPSVPHVRSETTPAAPKETQHCQSRAMSDAGCALRE